MSVTIENLTTRPVLLPLNSGQTLHLAPRLTSAPLLDVEVEQNAKVEKLQGQNVIAVHVVEQTADAPAADMAMRGSKKKVEVIKGSDEKSA